MQSEPYIVRTKKEIELLLEEARFSAGEDDTAYPAESYESGIFAVLAWLTDPKASHPLEWEDSLKPEMK